MRKILLCSVIALSLGACSSVPGLGKISEIFESAKSKSVSATAKSLGAYCGTAGGFIDERKSFVDAVNAKGPANIYAFDCDGDGRPDFLTEVETQAPTAAPAK